MARREDYLTPETLAAADEIDQMLAGMSPTATYQEPVPSVHVNDAIDDPLPPPVFIDLFQVMADASDPSTLPPVLIEGILHKGCKMILSGSSKAGKTLGLMHLGLAAANGLSWLGHNINRQCKVVYLDFEPRTFDIVASEDKSVHSRILPCISKQSRTSSPTW